MRIGIDAHMLGDHSGGNERFYDNILKYMSVPGDCTVYLFVREDLDVSAFAGKFRIIRLKSRSALGRYFRELPALCRELELDVLHTQYFIPFRRPCRTICTIHDICFAHNKTWFSKKEYLFQKTMIPYAARHADAVVTVSEFSRRDIADTFGVNDQKICVIYNAVDWKHFGKEADQAGKAEAAALVRAKFGIGQAPYILCVGNLNPRKNISSLIDAYRMMKEKYGGSQILVIAGKKDYRAEQTIQEARETGVGDAILFTGYVTNEELEALYSQAECFVYPSLYEGFGIPPLEAMACGTPVAVSGTTALPEVVADAGLYFDPEDVSSIASCLHRLLQQEDLREALISAGYDRVKAFDWGRSAQKLMDLYRGGSPDQESGRLPGRRKEAKKEHAV